MGILWNHSIEVEVLFLVNQIREEDSDSQIIHTKKITDKNEIKDPKEDTTFQVVKASG